MNRLRVMLSPKPQVPLGRWKLKHNTEYCDWWMSSLYPEPGYPNSYIKISSLNKKSKTEKNMIKSKGILWLQLYKSIFTN